MRRFVWLLAVVAAIALLAGCGGAEDKSPAATAENMLQAMAASDSDALADAFCDPRLAALRPAGEAALTFSALAVRETQAEDATAEVRVTGQAQSDTERFDINWALTLKAQGGAWCISGLLNNRAFETNS